MPSRRPNRQHAPALRLSHMRGARRRALLRPGKWRHLRAWGLPRKQEAPPVTTDRRPTLAWQDALDLRAWRAHYAKPGRPCACLSCESVDGWLKEAEPRGR